MKTLIIGAGPLGSLYATLLQQAGKDVTLLARNDHYKFVKEHGIVLINEFTEEKTITHIKVINRLVVEDTYDLVLVLMRKNSVLKLLPELSKFNNLQNILFMGNNTLGFEEYLKYLPKEKILFGFPGGGGSRIDHMVHYIDREKPNGKRMPAILGEMDGRKRGRTRQIQEHFESSGIPVKWIDDIDSWQKYHVAFVLPIGGALLKSGDNYQLSQDRATIRNYIKAVKEGGRVLKSLGYRESYNLKFKLFYWLPENLLIRILSKVFNSKFAEVAMMMHVRAAKDEMIELANEFRSLIEQSEVKIPNLDSLFDVVESEAEDFELIAK